MNDVYYSTYDQRFSLKPTIFKSNIEINFRKERVHGNSNHMALGSYAMRSRIPLALIKDIIEQLLIGNNNGK
jgi:C-5 cytosine-specific DNA methylase